MDEVKKYMINKEWTKDYKRERKLEIFRMAEQAKGSAELVTRIGGVLLYNQLIEQMLKEVIVCSICYIKAEIWPNKFQMNPKFDRSTFGLIINDFKNYAINDYNKDVIIDNLENITKVRNKVVHKMFEIRDFNGIDKYLEDYYYRCNETFFLLNEYYDQVCWQLYDLSDRVDFSNL